MSKQVYNIEKPLKVIELFSGVGTQSMALRNIGVDYIHHAISEWQVDSILSYNAIHTKEPKDYAKDLDLQRMRDFLKGFGISSDGAEPMKDSTIQRMPEKRVRQIVNAIINTNNLGSILNITADDLKIFEKDKFDYLMTYSFPCFTGDTLVMTSKGYKQIKDVKVGDEVMTHTKTFKKVLNTFDNGVKDVIKLKGTSFDSIMTTPNHKFYVREMFRYGHLGRRGFKEPQWVEAKDLTKKHYMGVPINSLEKVPTYDGTTYLWSDGRKGRHVNELGAYMSNKDFWWVIGRYIGDGWFRQQGGIIICCASNELEEVTSRLDKIKVLTYNVVKDNQIYKIHLPKKELGIFVEQFGRGASNKKLTNTVLDLPNNLLESFIEGYVSADGSLSITNNEYKITSVSRELIYGVAACVSKVYKTPYRLYKCNRKPTHVIEGRVVNQKPTYTLNYKKDKRKQDKAFYEDGYIWTPLTSKESVGKDIVYDIEVQDDHSFTVQNIIAHNCQSISVAGKQAGLSKGSGTRSGLLWEVERLLLELQTRDELPQLLLMENVAALLQKKFKADFDLWVEALEQLGYSNYYFKFNSRHADVAQNRDRVFMVSILGQYDYIEPQKVELTKKLKDYLDHPDDIPESFYLTKSQLESIIHTKYEKMGIDRVPMKDDVAPTIETAQGGGREPKVAYALSSREFDARGWLEQSPTLCARDFKDPKVVLEPTIIDIKSQSNYSAKPNNDVAPTQYAQEHYGIVETVNIISGTSKGYQEAKDGDAVSIHNPHRMNAPVRDQVFSTVLTTPNDNGILLKEDRHFTPKSVEKVLNNITDTESISGTITANPQRPTIDGATLVTEPNATLKGAQEVIEIDGKAYVSNGSTLFRIRKLMPIEAWRLMGIKDTDFYKAQGVGISNSQLYKQAGNAIVVDVLEKIFKQLYKSIREV